MSLVSLARPVINITEKHVVIRNMRQLVKPSDVQYGVPEDLKHISENYKFIFLYINSRIDNGCSLKTVDVVFFN